MKFSVLILPVLASGITALYVPDKLVQAFLKDSSEGNCCNETPCFIGCPVEGVFRLELRKSNLLTYPSDASALLLNNENPQAKINGSPKGTRSGRCMEFFCGSLSSADQTYWGEGGKSEEDRCLSLCCCFLEEKQSCSWYH
ncbi:hypothetical protein CSPX01_06035 [Colletotrichum filicis]|nr:hypothetical protein CSPX01_06035 [Colletotrichum filicis]